jgi:aspartate/tyrosine/aromatic aminotransferase
MMSFFKGIEKLPEDPLLSIPVDFAADTRTKKTNLGLGTYRDSEGRPFVLPVVRNAEASFFNTKRNKEYLPIEGDPLFLKETLKLIYGKESSQLAVQAIGGSAALSLGAKLLCEQGPRKIYLSDPSWPNHSLIFSRAGLNINFYPYYDPKTKKVNFSGISQAVKEMEAGSVILLQAACHNPTGVDLSIPEWKELSALLKKHKVLPFFDIAYHGFGEDLDKDAFAIRYFAEQGHEMLISYSYSKNMGLYGERVGALVIVTENEENVRTHIKQIIRSIYSTPPIHGAAIVASVLESENTKNEWVADLSNMRERIIEMRQAFVAGLELKLKDCDFSFILSQKGLFSYLDLTENQVHHLRKEFGIYMPTSGRINVAGLNGSNISDVIEAITSTVSRK